MRTKQALFSLSLLIFIAIVFIAMNFFFYPKWQHKGAEATIGWDVAGYYNYLPAIFIYGDLKQLSYESQIMEEYQPNPGGLQAHPHSKSGNRVIKYSAGMAIMYSPAFFTAHLWAKMSSTYPADGYSYPYQVMLSFWSMIVAFIGLWVMRKILLLYFDDLSTALALLSVVLASNYLDYAAVNNAMSHNYLFTLYALMLWQTSVFYKKATFIKATLIGIIAGLIALTRPTDIIIILIPILWTMEFHKKEGWIKHFTFLKSQFPKIVLAIVLCLLIGSIQLIYWKYVTGGWIYYSYEEGFRWLKPFIKEAWFSYRSGWLIYSPIFLIAFIGFWNLWKKEQGIWLAIFSFFMLFSYIVTSWENWWYGGGLGLRAMVQAYAILIIPIAAFWSMVLKQKWSLLLASLFLMLNIYYNGWLTYQAHTGGLLVPGQVNAHYFWEIVGRYQIEEDVIKLLDTDEIYKDKINQKKLIWSNDFEQDSLQTPPLPPIEGQKSLFVGSNKEFCPVQRVPLAKLEGGDWIRVEATYKIQMKEWTFWKMPQLILKLKKEHTLIKERAIRLHRLLSNHQERIIYMDIQLPSVVDTLEIQYWNAQSDKPTLIDELKVYKLE